MGQTVWAHNWEAGELSNTTMFQRFRMNENAVIKGVRTWFVVFNDPTFTNLNCKIYSDDNSSPGVLLHTSSGSRTKEELHTQDYAIRETYFNFGEHALHENTWYNFVINGTGYSPTASSYLAWVHSYPKPMLPGYTAAVETINSAPFAIYPIWVEL